MNNKNRYTLEFAGIRTESLLLSFFLKNEDEFIRNESLIYLVFGFRTGKFVKYA